MTTPLQYRDAGGRLWKLQTEPGDEAEQDRFIHGLPSGVVTNISDTATRLSTVITLLTSMSGYTDGLEALITTLNGYADGLETLIGTTNTNLTTLQGYVDQLEGYLDSVETKLQSIIDAQGVPSGGPKFGQASVTVGGNVQFASQALSRGMVIINTDSTNILLISHQTGPTLAGSTTRVLKAGLSTSFIACSNANAVYMNGSGGTIAACYEGV